jgi:hypothetical protein
VLRRLISLWQLLAQIWEPTDDPEDRRAGGAIFFGMRTHLQEPCGAGDVTLNRLCSKPSDGQFYPGCLLHFATISKLCLGIQNLRHDLPYLSVAAFATPMRIGTDALLELRMFRRLSVADVVITHFPFLVLRGSPGTRSMINSRGPPCLHQIPDILIGQLSRACRQTSPWSTVARESLLRRLRVVMLRFRQYRFAPRTPHR